MAKISELSIDIQDLLFRGLGFNTIAHILEIPVSWVYEVATQAQEFDQYIIDNDFVDEYE
jgi:hypothetical protein